MINLSEDLNSNYRKLKKKEKQRKINWETTKQ